MSKTEIQMVIDHHRQSLEGIGYQFKVASASLEPRWWTRSRRYLIAIDALSEASVGSRRIHILASARTKCPEILCLVEDALKEHLCEYPAPGAEANPPEMLFV